MNGTNGHPEKTSPLNNGNTLRDFPGAYGTNGHHVDSNNTNGINGHREKSEDTANNIQANGTYSPQFQLFVLSARSETALRAMVSNLHKWVSSHGSTASYFRDLAYTLSTRRTKMPYRFSAAAASHGELVSKLSEKKPRFTKSMTSFRSVFLFTGQGAQWHAMGRELTMFQPAFRKSMLKSDKILKQLGAEWSLIDELSRDEDTSRVGQAEISQPSTTAIQIALVDLLKSFGVMPNIVLGHSSGEIAAGYAAEALDQATALEISYRRGFMAQACARAISTRGAMMAVGLGEHDVKKYVDRTRKGLVCVACVNSPVSTTVSGDGAAIDELKQTFDEYSIFNRKLKVDTAYHSHHMKMVAGEYLESIAHIKARDPDPAIKFYSSVLVAQKTDGFGAQYWVDNLVSPVRFGNALDLLCRTELAGIEPPPLTLFTEVGPHGALAGPVRQTVDRLGLAGFKSNYLSTLVRGRHAVTSLLETAGKLFESGYPVDLEATLGGEESGTENNGTGHGDAAATLIDDLPPYPWDHSTSYVYESNLSKQHRFRAHPPHDLLGLRVPGTTDQEPTWRNFLGVDSLPWLAHHVVDGFAIYPAAAYLSMAIEAARQISIDRRVQGAMSKVHLKDVTFSKSIIIPERRTDGLTSDVEVLLTLRPAKHTTDRTWEMFRIMALSPEDVWHEHCSGSVMVELATSKEDEVEGVREEEMTMSSRLEQLQDIKHRCEIEYNREELYRNFTENGNVYGPTFSGIQSARIGSRAGIAEISIPDIASVMPRKYQQPHLIHPASFDIVFQLGLPIYQRNIGNGPVMPTAIDEVTINCNIGSSPGTKWVAATTMVETAFRFARVEIMVFEETTKGGGATPMVPIISIRGGALRGIGEAPLDESKLPFHRKMSYRLQWQPDVDFPLQPLPEGKDVAFHPKPQSVDEDTARHTLFETATAIHIRACLEKESITALHEEDVKPHLWKLLSWMKNYDSEERVKMVVDTISVQERARCLESTREDGIEGQMLSRIGESLPHIFAGDADPLSLTSEDDLLRWFYSAGMAVPAYLELVEYVQLLAFKQPHMKILELGSGTGGGGVALRLLQGALDRPEGLLLDQYDFTDDHGEGALEQAKSILGKWIHGGRVHVKILDICKDPIQQGFNAGAYDLVIASNASHGASSIDQCLVNSRKLLKPRGRLILVNPSSRPATIEAAPLKMICGTLPAQLWEFQDGSEKGGPLSSFPDDEYWNASLERHSLQRVDTVARSTIIVATPTDTAQQTTTLRQEKFPSVRFICQSNQLDDDVQSFAHSMMAQLTSQGFPCSLESWSSEPVDIETIYIVLDNMADPLLATPTAEGFTQIVSLVTRAKSVLWISCQASGMDVHDPSKGLINGLARVVRRENGGMRFVTVNLQENYALSSSGTLVSRLLHIFSRSFATPISMTKSDEDEYIVDSKGQILIPRVHADSKFDDWVKRALYTQNTEAGLFHQPDRPLKLDVETPGLLSSLRFVDDETPSNPLKPFDLELEAKAYGINFKDVFIAMGQMVPGVSMAGECAGVVRKVGSALADRFRIGDRICGFGAEPFSSYPRIDGNFGCHIPRSMPYSVGASVPVIFCTAYHCIVNVANLQRGQTILIHAASGGVGQAAIQLAQHIGAEIFCTVGSSAKRQLLIDNFNIPPSHIFSSRLRKFKQGILRLTQSKGVDCVLNSLSGDSLHDSFAVLAPLGTFVEIGKSDIYRKNEISMVPFDRNVTFAAVDLTVLARLKPAKVQETLRKVISMFEEGTLKAVSPITTMQITDIEGAFRLIQSRKHTGKVVLVCDDRQTTRVKLTLARPRPLQLDKTGTYVVAGGLGDLGRRIARFLASRGAGHVVTLSRRKLPEEDRLAFENELRVLGAELHVMVCDITDGESVRASAAECSESLPAVRGVVHAGMVLRVNLYMAS